ncbi:uncharacterized protein TrAtP1_007717 [Trichoderma atroviride]|uniref:uncharacterized protein n=1 Tax=Hypocrea atroviridis TaxID=63577 RepID=UPI00332FDC16|nr:hypothetical protein TrAtP1_007717 [Trichoderma atroviride]
MDRQSPPLNGNSQRRKLVKRPPLAPALPALLVWLRHRVARRQKLQLAQPPPGPQRSASALQRVQRLVVPATAPLELPAANECIAGPGPRRLLPHQPIPPVRPQPERPPRQRGPDRRAL